MAGIVGAVSGAPPDCGVEVCSARGGGVAVPLEGGTVVPVGAGDPAEALGCGPGVRLPAGGVGEPGRGEPVAPGVGLVVRGVPVIVAPGVPAVGVKVGGVPVTVGVSRGGGGGGAGVGIVIWVGVGGSVGVGVGVSPGCGVEVGAPGGRSIREGGSTFSRDREIAVVIPATQPTVAATKRMATQLYQIRRFQLSPWTHRQRRLG